MSTMYHVLVRSYVIAAAIALMGAAALLVLAALVRLGEALDTTAFTDVLLRTSGIFIIGFAVVETAKFILEDEAISGPELRSPTASRRSLTKFVTIVVIAIALESLVMIFIASRNEVSEVRYPATLLAAAAGGLVALGAYQWLSSRVAGPKGPGLR